VFTWFTSPSEYRNALREYTLERLNPDRPNVAVLRSRHISSKYRDDCVINVEGTQDV
jgi:hypothetical protein